VESKKKLSSFIDLAVFSRKFIGRSPLRAFSISRISQILLFGEALNRGGTSLGAQYILQVERIRWIFAFGGKRPLLKKGRRDLFFWENKI